MAKWRMLLHPCWSESDWIPSDTLIQECAGYSPRQIWKWLTKLEDRSLIEVRGEGDRTLLRRSDLGLHVLMKKTSSIT